MANKQGPSQRLKTEFAQAKCQGFWIAGARKLDAVRVTDMSRQLLAVVRRYLAATARPDPLRVGRVDPIYAERVMRGPSPAIPERAGAHPLVSYGGGATWL
jgi:hypothetical protein